MNLFERISSRAKEEGYLKTLQYGVLVGADTIKNYLLDSYLDLRYSGRFLHGNTESDFKHLGAHAVYHTDYTAMPLIFGDVEISPRDVLVDVGCGKGRVINYWLSKRHQNQIIGLEIDPKLAADTTRQFSHHPNVKIICGDAIENLPAGGTVFYFYNPFNAEKVAEFERKLSDLAMGNQVKVLYYNPKSLEAFGDKWLVEKINFEKDRGVKRWGRLNKYHDLAIITKKQ